MRLSGIGVFLYGVGLCRRRGNVQENDWGMSAPGILGKGPS